MARFRLTCPECLADVVLPPRRLLVRVDNDTASDGECLFTCLMCGSTIASPLDGDAVAALVRGGVSCVSLGEPVVEHPERPPAGPPLTTDDLLDLHAELAGDGWLDHLDIAGTS